MQTCPPQGHPNTTHSEPKRANQTKARQTNFSLDSQIPPLCIGTDLRKQSRITMTKETLGLAIKSCRALSSQSSSPGRVAACHNLQVRVRSIVTQMPRRKRRFCIGGRSGPKGPFTVLPRSGSRELPAIVISRFLEMVWLLSARGLKTLRNGLKEARHGCSDTVWEELKTLDRQDSETVWRETQAPRPTKLFRALINRPGGGPWSRGCKPVPRR